MKRIVRAPVFVLVLLSPVMEHSLEAQAAPAEITRELVALKHAIGRAYVEKDIAALERIYGGEYVVIGSDGSKRTKAQEIEDLRRGVRVYESSFYEDTEVRVYGDTALLSGRGTVKGKGPAGPFHSEYHSTNVFVRRDGRWQAVAAHISGVRQK